jgi:PIN domain nuclease of toxin-antitoxin system
VNFLLDTHVLLWWLADDPSLSTEGRQLIAEPTNVFFVSAASAWEISIKRSLGKLKAPEDLQKAMAASYFQPLPITIHHALAAGGLPRHHADPFDRMVIAQAKTEGLTLLTHDRGIKAYGTFVHVL